MNSIDSAFSLHEKALGVRSQRMEILSRNIANADTPNFKAQDIDFKAMLQDVKTEYLNAAQSGLDYVLGRNATGYSFVTGIGALSGAGASMLEPGPCPALEEPPCPIRRLCSNPKPPTTRRRSCASTSAFSGRGGSRARLTACESRRLRTSP